MKVSNNVFKSYYPSATQVSRQESLAQLLLNQHKSEDTLFKIDKFTSKSSYVNTKHLKGVSSVNLAFASTDKSLSSSLETFSTLNNKAKAREVFSAFLF